TRRASDLARYARASTCNSIPPAVSRPVTRRYAPTLRSAMRRLSPLVVVHVARAEQPGPALLAGAMLVRARDIASVPMHAQPLFADRDRIAIAADPEADRTAQRPESAASLHLYDQLVFEAQMGQ